MDDNITANPQNIPSSTSSSSGFDIQKELARVNREMYERNAELAIRNKTLSTLRKMYEIMNTSFEVEETAQKLIEAIVEELNFVKAFIVLVDERKKFVKSIALSPSNPDEQNIIDSLGRPIKNFSVLLSHPDNYCIKSIIHRQQRMTNSLYDVLVPMVDEKQAVLLAEKLDIKTSVIFPLAFAGDTFGALVICMNKHIGNLSHVELDTIRELIEVVSIAIERTQTYQELQKANKKLKDMDKLKDDFISFTSHELRTPLTAVKSYVWMILNGKSGDITEKTKLYLDRVFKASDRLIRLVNDMLNVSRIEGGRVEIHTESINVNAFISEIVEEFQARAIERKIDLSSEIPLQEIKVSADRSKIQEVMENLVGNALKFTPENGKVRILVGLEGKNAKFSVIDNGKGISKEDISKLFSKFGRLENAYVDMSVAPGSGLGLYISRQYVELNKGKIWIESEVGRGASFIFTLPLDLP